MGDYWALSPWLISPVGRRRRRHQSMGFWPPWRVGSRSHLPTCSFQVPWRHFVFNFWKVQLQLAIVVTLITPTKLRKEHQLKSSFLENSKAIHKNLVWIQRQGTTKLGKNETITSSQPPQHQRQRKKKTPVSTVWAIYIRWKETILCVHFRSLSYMKTLKKIIYPSAHPSTQLRGVPTKEP